MRTLSFFLLTIIILNVHFLYGQRQLAVKMGLTQSTLVTESNLYQEYEYKGGKALGISFINPFYKIWAIEYELMYLEYGGEQANKNWKYHYNYYSVATIFNLYVNRIIHIPVNGLNIKLLFGPDFLFLMNSEEEIMTGRRIIWRNVFDFGFTLGINLSYHSFLFESRFSHGFINTIDNPDDALFSNSEHNKAWQFMIGYVLNLF
ncbi:outer membrane beta-barrel protein [Calditrichota bacterium GD2]